MSGNKGVLKKVNQKYSDVSSRCGHEVRHMETKWSIHKATQDEVPVYFVNLKRRCH